ncbi:MAG: DsrE/DsrF/DrsH-like family protein [Candidatus Methanomethylicia archaeon]
MPKLSIILFSGTIDKFIPVGILSQTAASMNIPVRIFVTGWALNAFMKSGVEKAIRIDKNFEDMAPILMDGLKRMNAPSWYDMIKQAKQIGDVKVYACSLMAMALGINSKDQFDPIVDDIVGAASFLQEASDGQVIFI